MFCSKCGKQISDDAAFCDGCGAPTGAGATSAGNTTSSGGAKPSLPPILNALIGNIRAFFTTTNQTKVLVNSAKDTTWSGALVLIVTILLHACAAVVNTRQALGSITSKFMKFGSTFGFSLLEAAVLAVVAIVLLFVIATYVCKAKTTVQACVNIVAYATLPLIVVDLLGMAVGFIWCGLPVILSRIAMIVAIVLIMEVLGKISGGEKSMFLPALIFVTVMIVVAILFTKLTYGESHIAAAAILKIISDLC